MHGRSRRRCAPTWCAVFLVVLSGCSKIDATSEDDRTASERALVPAAPNQVDPSALAIGDSVLGLRLVASDVQPSLVDTAGWTGVMQFDGPITLSGAYRPHPEYPELRELCFFPDDHSAERLPIFPNDRRYAWLCFTNQERAWEALGPPPAEGEATITVDAYRYHYTHSDVYNAAELVDVITPTDSIADVEWVLASIEGNSILKDSRITLSIAEGAVRGYSGCNWYGGRLTETGDSLRFEDVSQTARLCMSPPGVVDQENLFGSILADVRSYRADGDSLQLLNADGDTVLVFRARTSRAMNPADLVESEWCLEALYGRTVDAHPPITLSFEEERIRGFGGCRKYTGTYTADGDTIRFPSLTMTELECSNEGMLETEGAYTTALSEATHYWLHDHRLDLYTVGGDTLSFVEASIER